jgi:hypothetical protein
MMSLSLSVAVKLHPVIWHLALNAIVVDSVVTDEVEHQHEQKPFLSHNNFIRGQRMLMLTIK